MNDLDPVFRRIATLNPVPREDELPSGAMTATALLVNIDELTTATATPTSPAASQRTKRGWPVAVATAAAVLVLLGGAALLFPLTGSDTPVADTVVPTTVTESTPTTLGDLVLTAGTWSRVPNDVAVFGGATMNSVTVGGSGFVAVGMDDPSYDENEHLEYGDAAVWTSDDGLTWSRVPLDEAVFGEAVSMSSVTAGGPGFVAVGGSDLGAVVWTSVDGVTWSRVPHDEAVFGGAEMSSVTVGGSDLVAVGESDSGAAVWTSVDGLTWTRVPHEEAVFGGDEQGMKSVTAGGPGLVAVGWFKEDAGENAGEDAYFTGAAVWTSPDGITWSRVPHDEAVFGGEAEQWMTSVTAGGPGLVAVGTDQGGTFYGEFNAPVWTSPDGITWSRLPIDEAVFGSGRERGGNQLMSVTAGGPGLVAVGGQAAPWLSDKGARVWTSPDGITWTRVPHEAYFGGASMNSVTVGGPGLVAVGGTWNDDIDAVVWVAATQD